MAYAGIYVCAEMMAEPTNTAHFDCWAKMIAEPAISPCQNDLWSPILSRAVRIFVNGNGDG